MLAVQKITAHIDIQVMVLGKERGEQTLELFDVLREKTQ
jgi:hypothetical protein